MATASFSATTRSATGKGVARKLRAAGKVPAVIYGHAREPQALELDAHQFQLLLEKVPYTSTVIELDIQGGKMARSAGSLLSGKVSSRKPGFASSVIFCPRRHSLSRYGPVPTGFAIIRPPGSA